MSDNSISRQAVVDLVEELETQRLKGDIGLLYAPMIKGVRALPSAQPEPCEDAVPRTSVEYICRKNTVSTNPHEHKYHDKFIQFMDDPEISDFGRWQHSNGFNTALVAVECDLDKVPSAQPQRMRGEWIEDGYSHYKAVCSECGESPLFDPYENEVLTRFCPWCGAEMETE